MNMHNAYYYIKNKLMKLFLDGIVYHSYFFFRLKKLRTMSHEYYLFNSSSAQKWNIFINKRVDYRDYHVRKLPI